MAKTFKGRFLQNLTTAFELRHVVLNLPRITYRQCTAVDGKPQEDHLLSLKNPKIRTQVLVAITGASSKLTPCLPVKLDQWAYPRH